MPISRIRWAGVLAVAAALTASESGAAAQSPRELAITAAKYQFEPSTIQVAVGERVRLVIRSKDGVHGFAIPTLKIDVQIPKGGDAVTVDLVGPPAGRYEIACSEFCGSGHGQMKAALISTAPTSTAR